MNNFFKIDLFNSDDGKYVFCNCCLLLGNVTVGDKDQVMVAGNLQLSLDLLLEKLNSLCVLICDKKDVQKILRECPTYESNVLPNAITAFDDYFGIFLKIENVEYLVLKLYDGVLGIWDNGNLVCVEITKSNYLQVVSAALKELEGVV